jgi:ABC-2 type transport system permease protein
MTKFVVLVKKELSSYFSSPMAYIILAAFLFISGLFFYSNMMIYNDRGIPADYEDTFHVMLFLTTLVTPLITMRLIAEEKNKGTIESLFTVPVTELQVTLAKFVSATLFYLYLLLPTIVHIVVLGRYADIDTGAIITGYFGLFLFATSLLSIGLFISVLCSNQISAGVITLVVALSLVFIQAATTFIKEEGSALNQFIRGLLLKMSFIENITPFIKGLLDTRPLLLFLSITGLFLFLTTKVLTLRRWI